MKGSPLKPLSPYSCWLRIFILSILISSIPTLAAPKPALNSLSPSSATAGSGGFTLTVNGSGFNGKCVVLWNGQALATTVLSGSSATAAVPSAEVASAGSDSITVQNTRTGATSNSLSFTVTATTAAVSVAVSVSPISASLLTGGTQQFTATVSGTTNTGVTWSATGGTVSTAGLYTAPATAGTYTVTATSVADSTKSASATVTVTAPVSVSISPNSVSLAGGASQQFTATVTGTTNTGVNWTSSGGAINSSGLYVAPTAAGTYTVTATSAADSTKSASATVTVTAPVSVSISPNSVSLAGGASQQFTATVTGTTNTGVSWTTSGGAISAGGLYVAPSTAGTYTVTATSAADTTKSATASITVNVAVSVAISPTAPSLLTGGTQQFTATVSGTTNTGVTWAASGGSITSAGLYTAPATAGTYTVTATSTADATKSASASVAVSAPVQHSAQLSWIASTSSGVTGYDIYRSTVSGSGYTLLNSAPDTSLSYTDSTVQAGMTYYYVVTAVTSGGTQSSDSTQVTAVIP